MHIYFCISSTYVTSGTKQSFWFWNIAVSEGGKQEKHKKKNVKFWPLNPYYRRSDWKIWLAEGFSEALTSNLLNKKNIYTFCQSLQKWSEIELYSPPPPSLYSLWFYQVPQIQLRDSHVKFTGKIKLATTKWAKLRGLIGQKRQNSFQYTHVEYLFVSIRQAGEQSLGL